jgi:hypothetical protein
MNGVPARLVDRAAQVVPVESGARIDRRPDVFAERLACRRRPQTARRRAGARLRVPGPAPIRA